MLVVGNSQPWQDVLKNFLCGDQDGPCNGELSGDALVKYFKPLQEWLDQQAKTLGYTPGWNEESDWKPKGFLEFPDEAHCEDRSVIEWLNQWHTEAETYFRKARNTEWEYNVDMTDEHETEKEQADAEQKARV